MQAHCDILSAEYDGDAAVTVDGDVHITIDELKECHDASKERI